MKDARLEAELRNGQLKTNAPNTSPATGGPGTSQAAEQLSLLRAAGEEAEDAEKPQTLPVHSLLGTFLALNPALLRSAREVTPFWGLILASLSKGTSRTFRN